MKWVSCLSTKVSLEAAVQDLAVQVLAGLGSNVPDLGLLFVSSAFASDFSRLLPLLTAEIEIPYLIGCSGSGVVAHREELEDQPAIALMVGHLPDVSLRVFHLEESDLPDLDSPPDRWQECVGISGTSQPNFVLLADAFSFPINDFLQGLDYAYPAAVKVGGLASSGGLDANTLFAIVEGGSPKLHRHGLLGLGFWGDLTLDAIVAQGCRPIGRVMQISECDRNLILSLEGKPPLRVLQDIINDLSSGDRELAQHSLFVGVVTNEFKSAPEPGDFLIRNIIGVDPRTGVIAVGDRLRSGQRVQLHLRDAQASAQDLRDALERYTNYVSPDAEVAAALMFSCVGRGERLYGKSNFDSQQLREYLGSIPLSGFFCSGEIGPVADVTYLHGYTTVLGILRPRQGT
ncbi:MAG: hypothetical protein HC919_02695 [Oscillatoriales cyanobacterium SM2_2_1]|nr:hypothetical protein [Oscillatoriales cyanobacterium SM2_2_1]